ncbi:hypothetical protein D1007_37261 [Hordeum vulgare]|nr:hypothetical protein D1007_37261 [Hordeum vulgare]
MPMCTCEVTILPQVVDAEEGSDGVARVVSVDWNSVELNDPTDLVIAPMNDTEMINFFDIPVADEDKEEKDGESSMTTNTDPTRDRTEDVDGQMMEDVVDDAHDDELVNVYDKENHVIVVGKLFPNMDEFRVCFNTYAVKHEFDAKTKWIDRKMFYARCRGFDGSVKPCKWRKRADLDGVLQNEQDLDVLLQDEHDFDVLVPTEDMGTYVGDIAADVVQSEPMLEIELPSEDIPSNVVPIEPIFGSCVANP